MIDPENMMGKLAHLGLLGATQDPDSQGHWRTGLGSGQTLVYGPDPSPPGWFWVVYNDAGAALSTGDEPSADAMAEHVRMTLGEARPGAGSLSALDHASALGWQSDMTIIGTFKEGPAE